MQLYDQSGTQAFGSCCSLDDLHDARRVAAAIGIPHYILNFERQFQQTVVANFVGEYVAGRTPLPCAHCNSDLKFSTLLERAQGLGAEVVATGHYARVERSAGGAWQLRRGVDPDKDQSYYRRRRHEVAGAAGEIEIGDGEGRGQERAGVAHELVRQHVDIGQDGDRQHHDGQRRQDPPDPPLVEGDERESPGRDLVDDHRADEIARDHEEDVHPDEAAAKQRPLRMERDHRCHGDGAQAVDVLPIGANHFCWQRSRARL